MGKTGKEIHFSTKNQRGISIYPKMFISLMEEIFNRMKKNYKLSINGSKLYNLHFADNFALITESHRMLQDICNFSK